MKSHRDHGLGIARRCLREKRNKAQLAVDVARSATSTTSRVRAPFDGFVTVRTNMMAFGGIVFQGAMMPDFRVGDVDQRRVS